MYLTSHLMVAMPLMIILAWGLHKFQGQNISRMFYFIGASASILPDIDHIFFWRDVFWRRILPFSLVEIPQAFYFSFRIPTIPELFLHLWAYPFLTALVLAANPRRMVKYREYLWATMLGWSLHLVLDGCLKFV